MCVPPYKPRRTSAVDQAKTPTTSKTNRNGLSKMTIPTMTSTIDANGIPQPSQPDKLGHNETRGTRRFWPSSLILHPPLKPGGIPPVLQRLQLLKEPSSEIVLCPSLISFGIRSRVPSSLSIASVD